MDLLIWSKLGKTPAGKKELTQLIAALAFTPEDWHPEDPEYIDRLIQCTQHALPLFTAQVESTQFVNIFCDHVLGRWKDIAARSGENDLKLELLKIFAEVTEHCGEIENAEDKIKTTYDMLLNYLPEAPVEKEEEKAAKTENDENKPEDTKSAAPSLQFSHVECALFALHSLCRKAPDALGADAARIKSLRLRLQYTARLTQGYIKKLKEVTQGKKGEDANTEENKLKLVALKTTSNINTLIRDIFRTPPSFKSKVQLSFQSKKAEKEATHSIEAEEVDKQTSVSKRHRPITFDNRDQKESPEKRPRSGDRNLKMYTPPSGKYSSRLNNSGRFSGSNYGRGRGGYGRRDFRNNGAPFKRRNNF
uniref:Apoptosis inhibitor n=1 Tax=Pararge aegeria TaxID=116150 RepID=S4PRT4_9NEOP